MAKYKYTIEQGEKHEPISRGDVLELIANSDEFFLPEISRDDVLELIANSDEFFLPQNGLDLLEKTGTLFVGNVLLKANVVRRGVPLKYGEPTTVRSIRFPESLLEAVEQVVAAGLAESVNEFAIDAMRIALSLQGGEK